MTVRNLNGANKKVMDLLQQADSPLSAYEILDKLRKKGVRSPPTVYRALEKLQDLGLVHRVESLGAFVACRCEGHVEEGGTAAQAAPFAICTSCGRVEEIDDPAFSKIMRKLGKGFLAQIKRKVFEISGTCALCVEQQNKGSRNV